MGVLGKKLSTIKCVAKWKRLGIPRLDTGKNRNMQTIAKGKETDGKPRATNLQLEKSKDLMRSKLKEYKELVWHAPTSASH
jgi:hypothetical protein